MSERPKTVPAHSSDSRARADFSGVVGHWTPDPVFDEILDAQRQIDWDKWK